MLIKVMRSDGGFREFLCDHINVTPISESSPDVKAGKETPGYRIELFERAPADVLGRRPIRLLESIKLPEDGCSLYSMHPITGKTQDAVHWPARPKTERKETT